MPGIDSERLGVLWRSQGEEFLQEQAVTLQADMDRLRAASQQHPRFWRGSKVIDLREKDVTGMACSTAGHGDVVAATRCARCRNAFCRGCVLQSEATRDQPFCTVCALTLGGVYGKGVRLLASVARRGQAAP